MKFGTKSSLLSATKLNIRPKWNQPQNKSYEWEFFASTLK